jgi:hypothetical protein
MVSLNTPPPLPNLLSSVSNQGQSGPRNPILKRVRYFAMARTFREGLFVLRCRNRKAATHRDQLGSLQKE